MTDEVEPVTTAYATGNLQQPPGTGDVERAELEQRVRAQVADEQAAWLPELLHVVWGFAMGEHTGTAQLTAAHAEEALRHVPGAILDAAAVRRTTQPAGPVAADDAAGNQQQPLTTEDVERIADDALRTQFKPLIQKLVDDQLQDSAAAIEATVRGDVAADLKRAATGRRHYADQCPPGSHREYLVAESDALAKAARLALGDALLMSSLIPASQWTHREHAAKNGQQVAPPEPGVIRVGDHEIRLGADDSLPAGRIEFRTEQGGVLGAFTDARTEQPKGE